MAMQVPIEQLDIPTFRSLLRGTTTRLTAAHPFISDEFGPLEAHLEKALQMDGIVPMEYVGHWRARPTPKANSKAKKKTLRSQPSKTAPISILGEDEGVEMARRIVSPNALVTTGMFPSFKMKTASPWEGLNEFAAYSLLEIDPNVAAYFPQPKWLTVKVGEELKDHCPDFLVRTKNNGEWFVEVKPDAVAEEDSFIKRSEAVARFLARQGYGYAVLKGSAVNAEPRLYNAGLLFHHSDNFVPDQVATAIVAELRGKSLTIQALAFNLRMDTAKCFGVCLHLYLQGAIVLDWTDRFHYESLATIAKSEAIQ
jgi:hypothetical protein